MATVRLSSRLIGDIRNHARYLFRAPLKEAVGAIKADWGERIYLNVFKDTLPIIRKLPKEYFRLSDTLHLTGIRGETWDSAVKCMPVNSLKLTQPYPVPYEIPGSGHGLATPHHRVGPGLSFVLNADDPRWSTLKPEYFAYCKAIQDITDAQTKFVEGVDKVLHTYSTLSPALKAWPPLWDLLGEEIQDRHKEIKERKVAPKVLPDSIDTTNMTAVITRNKLLGND